MQSEWQMGLIQVRAENEAENVKEGHDSFCVCV